VSTDAGATWSDVPQATSPYLSFVPTLADSGNLYRAVFTDGGGATVVSRAALLTVAKATPIVTVSADPSRWTDDATFTVRVATDASTPRTPGGGSVTLRVGWFTATRPLVNGVATFVAPHELFAPGTILVEADYDGGGDPVFGSSSGTLMHTVLRALTSITLSKNVAEPYYGQPILVTAELSRAPWAAPTGLVNFTRPGYITNDVIPVGPTFQSSAAFFETYAYERENNVIEARYLGDDWFEPAVAQALVFDTTPIATELSVFTPSGTLSRYGNYLDFVLSIATDSFYGASGELRLLI
ncbi:hypothetical protein HK102_011526, partial [Quaeritorhiza haematococci]